MASYPTSDLEKIRIDIVKKIEEVEKLPSFFDPSTKPMAYSTIMTDSIRLCGIPKEIEMSKGAVVDIIQLQASGECDVIVYDTVLGTSL